MVTVVLGVPVLLTGCGSDSGNSDDQVAGKQLFVKNCGACHVLSRAGTKGTTGPNLDQAFQQSLKDGFGRDAIKGLVKKQIEYPTKGVMPAKILDGQEAADVAAYVSSVVAAPGKDAGVLADAVKSAGAGKPIAAKNGTLSIAADPGGQLAYVSNKATSPPGKIELQMPNQSGIDHNLAVQSGTNGPVLAKTPIIKKGVAKATVTLKAGTYTYFCEVPGHRAAGMLGTLVVK